MKRIVVCLACVAVLSACETGAPKGTSVNVNSNGVNANTKVVDGDHVNVKVGTNGVKTTVGAGPVKVNKKGVKIKF